MKHAFCFITLLALFANFGLMPAPRPAIAQSDSSCLFIFSLQEVTILVDEGDGLFDDLMEIEILLVTSEDSVNLPDDGVFRVSQNESITFDNVRLLGTRNDNIIYMLLIEIDQPLISFSSVTRIVLDGLIGSIDPLAGSIFTALITEGVAYLEDLAFTDKILSEESIIIPLDSENSDNPIRHVTTDGNVEITYTVDWTQGCNVN